MAASRVQAVLDLISRDITSQEAVSAVLDRWAALNGAAEDDGAYSGGAAVAVPPAAFGGACSVLVVLRRQCYLALSDPLQYMARFVMCPFVCCFFGLVYIAARKNEQEQVPFRLFYLWWILAVPPCLNIISIIGATHEIKLAVSEIKNGTRRPCLRI